MEFIRVFDRKENKIVQLMIRPNNVIRTEYFTGTFPGATGLRYRLNDSNELRRSVIRELVRRIENEISLVLFQYTVG